MNCINTDTSQVCSSVEIELSVDKGDTIFDSRTVNCCRRSTLSVIEGRPSVHKPLGDVEFYNQL